MPDAHPDADADAGTMMGTTVLEVSKVAAHARSTLLHKWGAKLTRANGVFRLSVLALVVVSGAARAQDTVPPKVEMTTPGGVNVGDGSYMMNVTDLTIGPLTLQRFKQPVSLGAPNDPFFGAGMTHNFDIYVAPNFIHQSGSVPAEYHPIVHIGNSASGVYLQGSLGGTDRAFYELNDDARSGKLEWSSNAYKYTDGSGTVYRFNTGTGAGGIDAGGLAGVNSRRVASITFPDGRVQTFSYVANRLKMVSDSSGYAMVFDNNAAGDVVAACGFNLSQDYVTTSATCTSAPLKVSYGYTGGGGFSTFTDVTNLVTTYTSTAGPNGTWTYCIKPTGYADCKIKNTYDTEGRVTQQIIGGSTWNTYTDASIYGNDPEYVPSNCDSSASFGGPNGTSASFALTKSSPCSMTDANGKVTSYVWTGGKLYSWTSTPTLSEGTMLVEATMPEGDKYLAEYDVRNSVTKQTWKAKSGSSLADRIMETGYSISGCTPQNCTKPLWKTDAKGNRTDFTYASWGGTLSEMQPAPVRPAASPPYWPSGTPASDTVRALKLYDYVQKRAYVKDAGGALVAGSTLIWVPNSETLCQTAAGGNTPVCDAAAPKTVTTYEYGADGTANNLLVRSKVVTADWAALRTCYGYDPKGRKIWERSPRGLGACL
jgi:hypothetical protein